MTLFDVRAPYAVCVCDIVLVMDPALKVRLLCLEIK